MKKLRGRVEKVKGLCVGLDLHKKFIQVSVLDERGDEIMAERIASTEQAVTALIEGLSSRGLPLSVALEASGCFVWVYDLLIGLLGRSSVRVAAPSKVKVIAESGEKTDAGDAWWLGYLLQEGRLPEAFVAEGDLRDLRIACRELRRVTDTRSDVMRRMRSHLAQLGWSFARSDWASQAGRQRIESLVARARAEHGVRGEAIARLWGQIGTWTEEVGYWTDRVEQLSRKFDQIKLLADELPGVGAVVGAVIWSELSDPSRYASAKGYAKATGLTPGYRESGGRRQKKHILRDGSSYVRWALTRAVLACSRCRRGVGVAVWQWVLKMSRRKPKKAAMVAAARKLAEGVWRLFALGESFDLRRMFPA